MPRYRKLHVKTVESLDLNEMPDDLTRLMWVLLPLALCREGRGLHSGAWLKSKLFPLREDINSELVWSKFQWFIGRGMVIPYEIEGRSYFYVPTFHKYQGNTVKEAESDYPAPPESRPTESGEQAESLQTYSRPTPELVQSKSDTDAIFNIQYSDADAEKDPAPDGAPPKEPTPHQAMFGALLSAYRWDGNLITEKQRGRLNAESKRLLKGNKTPRDVWSAGEWWWENDWRGKKGSAPTYGQLVETLGKLDVQQDEGLTTLEAYQ